MNTGRNSTVEPSVAKMLDPYSSPRTIPGGWDVTVVQIKKTTNAGKNTTKEPNVAKMLDPYSTPRTIPGGWDISAFSKPEHSSVETFGDSSSHQSSLNAASMGKNEPA